MGVSWATGGRGWIEAVLAQPRAWRVTKVARPSSPVCGRLRCRRGRAANPRGARKPRAAHAHACVRQGEDDGCLCARYASRSCQPTPGFGSHALARRHAAPAHGAICRDRQAGRVLARAHSAPAWSMTLASCIYQVPSELHRTPVLGGAADPSSCRDGVSAMAPVRFPAGDLLRAERERPGSQYGDLINTYIKEVCAALAGPWSKARLRR